MGLYGGARGGKGVDEGTLSKNNRPKCPQCPAYTDYTASFIFCPLILSLGGVQCHASKRGGCSTSQDLKNPNCCCPRIFESGCYSSWWWPVPQNLRVLYSLPFISFIIINSGLLLLCKQHTQHYRQSCAYAVLIRTGSQHARDHLHNKSYWFIFIQKYTALKWNRN